MQVKQKEKGLIVFLKNPAPGRVKTRLAASTGDHAALAVYLELIRMTRDAVSGYGQCDVFLYFSDHLPDGGNSPDADWAAETAGVRVQEGPDLGIRMLNAFTDMKKTGYKRICIIGTDCPGMRPDILTEAFDALETNDLAIGPALDGGYYLLGLTVIHSWLFTGKEWSTDSVLKVTLADAARHRQNVHMLPALMDLDDAADLIHFPDLHKLANNEW